MVLTPVVAASSALAFFLVLHVVVWRTFPAPRKTVFTMALLALIAYVGMAAAGALLFTLNVRTHLPVSAPLFAFLTVCYFHFYYGIDRSVSVRILGALAQAPNGRLSLDELDALYPREEMIRRRLAIMIENGWLREEGGFFMCRPKAGMLVRLARLGGSLYNLEATG